MFKINEQKKELLDRQLFKEERMSKVRNIVVEVDGLLFDGDEISQNRMARCLVALEPEDVINWTLADNTTVAVNRATLKEALLLAGEAQTQLWSKGE